ncbi:unnamed protein product, partial [Meganyctiphanes norvegica]
CHCRGACVYSVAVFYSFIEVLFTPSLLDYYSLQCKGILLLAKFAHFLAPGRPIIIRMPQSLKIWSFSSKLTKKDQSDLVKHFGAITVKYTRHAGREDAIIASFASESDCVWALGKLHQLDVLGKRLMVTYHSDCPLITTKEPHKSQSIKEDLGQKDKLRQKLLEYEAKLCAVASHSGSTYPISTKLRYLYPPPSPMVIHNIAHNLLNLPKFYTQVLHLMNKLNLPPPFRKYEDITLPDDIKLYMAGDIIRDENFGKSYVNETVKEISNIESGEMQEETETLETNISSSTTESELESEEEGELKTVEKIPSIKRKMRPKKVLNKKPKLSLLKQTCIAHERSSAPTDMREVFDATNDAPGTRRMELRLEGTILPQEQEKDPHSTHNLLEPGGFGKMEVTSVRDSDSTTDKEKSSKFITAEELESNRVPDSDWPILPVFKNYKSGNPSTKLYIKNLAKNTHEEHLKHIYGKYINWHFDEEVELFNIRVMKEGRMKGQGFISFPSVELATQALRETNGYILNDKPMVVMFGRTKSSD